MQRDEARLSTPELDSVADLRGVGGANEPSFGLDLVQQSTGDRLNGTPSPFLREERNLLLWLTSACLSGDLDQKRMD